MTTLSPSKRRGLAWLLGTVMLVGLFSIELEALIQRIPWSTEQAFARRLTPFKNEEVCLTTAGPTPNKLLTDLVLRLHPLFPGDSEIPLRVDLIRGDTVNAFATLGGRILIFEGLLSELTSPAELAAVLAHEIEHLRHRDVLKGSLFRLTNQLALQLILGGDSTGDAAEILLHLRHSRSQEARADRGAIERLIQAKISPVALATFFERLSLKKDAPPLEILSSHPDGKMRANLARTRAEGTASSPIFKESDWQKLRAGCS